MASTAAQNYISLDVLLNCCYSMIGVVSGFAITRIGIRITRPKALAAEDALVLLAYLTFLVSTTLYIKISANIFRVSAVINGTTLPYPELPQDAMEQIRTFFATTLLFWCTLWLVKASLLSLYWRLLQPSRLYRKFWWAVVVFCAVVNPLELMSAPNTDLAHRLLSVLSSVTSPPVAASVPGSPSADAQHHETREHS